MNLLLDTHAWLWFVLGDARLSAAARSHILDAANVKFVSPASYWEISIKISLGKYALNAPYQPIYAPGDFVERIQVPTYFSPSH